MPKHAVRTSVYGIAWTVAAALLRSPGVSAFSANRAVRQNRRIAPLPEDVVEAQLRLLKKRDIEQAYERYLSPDSKLATEFSWHLFAEEILSEPFSEIVGHSDARVLMTVFDNDDDDDDDDEPISDSPPVSLFGPPKHKHRNSCKCLVRVSSAARRTQRRIRTVQDLFDDDDDSDSDDDSDDEDDCYTDRTASSSPVTREFWWELSKYPASASEEYDGSGNDLDKHIWMVNSVTPDFESMDLEELEMIGDEVYFEVVDEDEDDEDDYDIFGGSL